MTVQMVDDQQFHFHFKMADGKHFLKITPG